MAYQKQLRDRHSDEGMPPGLDEDDLILKRARVKPVGKAMAERIILKYEWLGTMAPTSYHYGIFFGMYCAGVVCVAGPNGVAGNRTHEMFGIDRRQLRVLARGACVHWAPAGTNSKLISWAMRLMEKEGNGKICLAYSDLDAGEIGTVYQAANWTYIGPGSATQQWVAPNGAVYDAKHPANLRARKGGTRQYWVRRLIEEGWTQQKSNPKHRYVKVIDTSDKELMTLVQSMAMPYPKRHRTRLFSPSSPGESSTQETPEASDACAGSIDGDASVSPGGTGRFDPDPRAPKEN